MHNYNCTLSLSLVNLFHYAFHIFPYSNLALQEAKVEDRLFPVTECINLGYKYITYSGQKSYNGVAILSRISFESTFAINLYNDEKKHIAINIGELSIHNFYVPAGGDIPDANVNIKFKHKLCYVDFMNAWFLNNKSKKDKIILLGDLNIALLESDVWSSYQLRNVVSHMD
ncbi:exodeoxyribonuclease III [Orientia tsutsugamushi]|uniref:endonuclease/exonuclease/phosphatase family protein n=1 Tax=Orientia tsutsugamushi TaxID=784 RepID=UPI00061F3F91|nr:endonuclease/exonuclease/phosphatase family protein [Orientia tsutsugamushi]KJV75901.1 endonuclease/Exonuclease/phosphatase family protein [Orientia tsutsugamushi str. TA763]SPP24105.1 exodeoxyribonuclease III [Orientia tsutsugamushi]